MTGSAASCPGGWGLRTAWHRASSFQAEVAALFGQHGPDEADDRLAVGEDTDHVGAAAGLTVEPLSCMFASWTCP